MAKSNHSLITAGNFGFDVVTFWLALLLSLLYMGLTPQPAVLAGAAIVLHSLLGSAILLTLFPGLRPSTLLACGPGLMLGGPFSFMIFQFFGRGAIGAWISIIVSGVAGMWLVKRGAWETLGQDNTSTLVVVGGISAVAMSSQFSQMLISAVGLFVVSTALRKFDDRHSPKSVAPIGFGLLLVLVPFISRNDSWGIITDDYLFLEVLTQHIVREGPLADWGVLNWGSYHWLSYGWAGLLDVTTGQTHPLITLTRVMPLVYSVSLGASLLLVPSLVGHQKSKHLTLALGVVTVIAFVPLDWSGTSTAAALPVLAATVIVLSLTRSFHQSLFQRLITYVVLGLIAALTKLPIVIALIALFFANEFLLITQRPVGKRLQSKFSAVAIFGVIVSLVAFVVASRTFGRFILTLLHPDFSLVNPRAPIPYDITQAGVAPAVLAMVVVKSWFIIPLVLVLVSGDNEPRNDAAWFFQMCAYLFAYGIFLDLFVFGDASSHEYFSHPMYFLAAISMLYFLTQRTEDARSSSIGRKGFELSSLIVASLGWSYFARKLAGTFEGLPGMAFGLLSDAETGAALGFVVLIVATRTLSKGAWRAKVPLLLLCQTILLLGPTVELGYERLQKVTPRHAVNLAVGSPSTVEVGRWVDRHTPDGALLATNYLISLDGRSAYDTWALAAWSQREYLITDVTGPWFDTHNELHRRAKLVSESFAGTAESATLDELIEQGVGWFVVNRNLTSLNDWGARARIQFSNRDFVVLKLS